MSGFIPPIISALIPGAPVIDAAHDLINGSEDGNTDASVGKLMINMIPGFGLPQAIAETVGGAKDAVEGVAKDAGHEAGRGFVEGVYDRVGETVKGIASTLGDNPLLALGGIGGVLGGAILSRLTGGAGVSGMTIGGALGGVTGALLGWAADHRDEIAEMIPTTEEKIDSVRDNKPWHT